MFARKDLLGIRDLSQEEIQYILNTAREMKEKVDCVEKRSHQLDKISMATLFYENSTRTRMSFALAGEYLGASVLDLGVASSSVKKGESLIDTGVTLDQMGIHVMIIRHGMTGSAHLLARNVNACVINAGDGSNEHPTQALLDIFTIQEKKGRIKGLKVAIVGDIAHSRVARSNIFGLTKLGAEVVLAGPSTLLSKGMEVLGAKVTTDIKSAVKDADVVMGLRVQLERQKGGQFPDLREYSHLFGVDEKILRSARPDALIMHPGPVNRGIELSTDIIDGPQSVINEQVKNGVAVRMALLSVLIEGRKQNETAYQTWKSHRPSMEYRQDTRCTH